jgi:hypothetical protein
MEDLALVATVPVAKDKVFLKSGPKKGKIRPGCYFKKKRAYCTPEVAARLKAMGGGTSKKKGSKRGPIIPKSPETARNANAFQSYLQTRAMFKAARESGNCAMMREAARATNQVIQFLSTLPVKATKKNPTGDPRPRNRRYIKEMERMKAETMQCSIGGPAGRASSTASNAAARAQYEAFMASRGVAPAPASEWEKTAREALMQENLRRIERARTTGKYVGGLSGSRKRKGR